MTRSAVSVEGAAPAGRSVSAVGARLVALVASHPVLDAYAGFVPPLLVVLETRCNLTVGQTAALLGLGSLVSGLCQPLFAWLTDRIDSRAFGTVGLAVAAATLSSIGLARDFGTLLALFTLGMLGVGAFHPVAAASVGQLAGRRRSAGVTAFFVAGMVGATAGPILSTRITAIEPNGFDLLRWAMVPGLVLALVLHLAVRDVPHRHHEHRTISFSPEETRRRWTTAAMLFAGNAMRYSVYMALIYLYVHWTKALVTGAQPGLESAAVARAAAIYCGELNAAMMAGMGIGGLLAGFLVRPGREKWPIVLIPLALAPAIAAFPLAGRGGSYALAVAAGVGFASIIPITISLGQRLLPHRTSLASSLMMGGAWAVAALGPPAAELGRAALGTGPTFALVACLLAASGLAGLPIPRALVREIAEGDGGAGGAGGGAGAGAA